MSIVEQHFDLPEEESIAGMVVIERTGKVGFIGMKPPKPLPVAIMVAESCNKILKEAECLKEKK